MSLAWKVYIPKEQEWDNGGKKETLEFIKALRNAMGDTSTRVQEAMNHIKRTLFETCEHLTEEEKKFYGPVFSIAVDMESLPEDESSMKEAHDTLADQNKAKAAEEDAEKTRLQAVNEENSNLECIIGELKTDHEAYVQALEDTHRAELEALEEDNKSLEADLKALKAELETLKEDNKSLEADLEALEEDNKSLEADLEALKEDNKSKEAELEALKEAHKSELDALDKMNKELHNQLKAFETKSANLLNTCSSLRRECAYLKGFERKFKDLEKIVGDYDNKLEDVMRGFEETVGKLNSAMLLFENTSLKKQWGDSALTRARGLLYQFPDIMKARIAEEENSDFFHRSFPNIPSHLKYGERLPKDRFEIQEEEKADNTVPLQNHEGLWEIHNTLKREYSSLIEEHEKTLRKACKLRQRLQDAEQKNTRFLSQLDGDLLPLIEAACNQLVLLHPKKDDNTPCIDNLLMFVANTVGAEAANQMLYRIKQGCTGKANSYADLKIKTFEQSDPSSAASESSSHGTSETSCNSSNHRFTSSPRSESSNAVRNTTLIGRFTARMLRNMRKDCTQQSFT